MRNALIISLVFHLSVYFLSTRIVRFSRVRYVPRQVYAVSLFSLEEAEQLEKNKEKSSREKPPTSRKKDTEQESMKAPPDELPPPTPRKKPVEKKKQREQKKVVPSSEVRNETDRETHPSETVSKGDQKQAVTGDMNLDAPDFPFGYYLVSIRRKIAGNWSVPHTSAGEEKFCRVYFKIARNGQIVSPVVENSSGSFLFDQAALRAVFQASPLPPLPGEFGDEYLGVHFSFAYEER